MGDWSRASSNLGPWIISAVALLQVWVIAAWRRFGPARLDLFQSHSIEIGYSQFGPTVGLLGTLRTRRKDFFVRALIVTVTRKNDNLTRTFNWRAFRSHKFTFSIDEKSELELAGSFLLRPEAPWKYNIFFVDDAFLAEYGSKVNSIAPAWFTFSAGRGVDVAEAMREKVFAEFLRTTGPLEAYQTLDRAFYWTAGHYWLNVEIVGANGQRRTLRKFTFELSSEDEANLRTNIVSIERFLCAVGAPPFQFANPKYVAA